jgi:hypothetical protein
MSLPSAMTSTLSTEELRLIDAYWRAANYVVESCGLRVRRTWRFKGDRPPPSQGGDFPRTARHIRRYLLGSPHPSRRSLAGFKRLAAIASGAPRRCCGWSLYVAPWLQPLSISGKSDRRRLRGNKPKLLPWVATGCR